MKKSILSVLVLVLAFTTSSNLFAQKFPKLDVSPMDAASYPTHWKNSDKLVKVIYGRPQLKGRDLSKLAPNDKVWRTGANEAAEITFYKDVVFGGKDVKAGTYSLFTIPTDEDWTIIISNQRNVWGSYFYKKEQDVIRVSGKVSESKKNIAASSITFNKTEDAKNLNTANTKSKLVVIDNMNHILKDIQKDEDNMKSYYSPDYTISSELVKVIVDFVNKNQQIPTLSPSPQQSPSQLPSPVNPKSLGEFLVDYDSDQASYLINGFTHGFILGFTPGASTVLSSNAAHRLEIFLQKNYKQGNYKALVGAESANNSAAFTTLMPLFILALPLTASEALFYDIMSIKGFTFDNVLNKDFFFNVVIYNMIIINILAFLVAWPFAKYVSILYKIPYLFICSVVFCLLIYVMWILGAKYFQSWYFLQVFFCLLPIGYLLRKYDLIPLIFVFILQDKLHFTAVTIKDLFFGWT